jgi:type IV secretory pathway TrbD component
VQSAILPKGKIVWLVLAKMAHETARNAPLFVESLARSLKFH